MPISGEATSSRKSITWKIRAVYFPVLTSLVNCIFNATDSDLVTVKNFQPQNCMGIQSLQSIKPCFITVLDSLMSKIPRIVHRNRPRIRLAWRNFLARS